MTSDPSEGDEDDDLEDDDLEDDGSEDDGSEDDDSEEDDSEDDELANVTRVERLSSVDAWEMYRMISEDTALVVGSVAIRPPGSGEQAIEYAAWRPTDLEEPGATGYLERRSPGKWDDDERALAIREVLRTYDEDFGVDPEKARFLFQESEDEQPESGG